MYKTFLLISKNILLSNIHVFMPTHQNKLIIIYALNNITKLTLMTTGDVKIDIGPYCVLHLELFSICTS